MQVERIHSPATYPAKSGDKIEAQLKKTQTAEAVSPEQERRQSPEQNAPRFGERHEKEEKTDQSKDEGNGAAEPHLDLIA